MLQVEWGLSSGAYTSTSSATTLSYARTDMCGGPVNGTGWFPSGSLHTAVMSGLQPATKYFYRYGSAVREPLAQLHPSVVQTRHAVCCMPLSGCAARTLRTLGSAAGLR